MRPGNAGWEGGVAAALTHESAHTMGNRRGEGSWSRVQAEGEGRVIV